MNYIYYYFLNLIAEVLLLNAFDYCILKIYSLNMHPKINMIII